MLLYGEDVKLLSLSGLVHPSCKKDADGISGVCAGGGGADMTPWLDYVSQGLTFEALISNVVMPTGEALEQTLDHKAHDIINSLIRVSTYSPVD